MDGNENQLVSNLEFTLPTMASARPTPIEPSDRTPVIHVRVIHNWVPHDQLTMESLGHEIKIQWCTPDHPVDEDGNEQYMMARRFVTQEFYLIGLDYTFMNVNIGHGYRVLVATVREVHGTEDDATFRVSVIDRDGVLMHIARAK